MTLALLIAGASLILAAFVIWAVRYTKVGPNEVLIISGRRRIVAAPDGRRRTVGYRLVHGGGTFVWPIKEKVQRLSLELMTLEVRTPEVYTLMAIPVTVDGVAQVKVQGDEASVAVAAEQFLSRSRDDVMRTVLQTLEGHMRAILGTMTVEDIYRGRQDLARRVREAATEDLAKMGLEIISLTIRNVADSQGYLEALARPRIAQVKRDAVKGEAEADREAQQARFESETKIEEARRDLELRRAQFDLEVKARRAEADLSYDLHRFKTAQQVKAEEIQVGIVEREKAAELEEVEIRRKERELVATVLKPAEAESQRIQLLADAERHRLEAEGLGQGEEIKARGLAEAEVVRERGAAEAETMARKAESWSRYNEAAVTELLVNVLPQLARSVAEPLSKLEKIVVISGNGGTSTGASKISGDVAAVVAQLPEVIEALTGVRLRHLLEKVPALGKTAAPPQGDGEDGGTGA